MNIRLHIDRLVLDGLAIDRPGAEEVGAALTAELAHRLSSNGAAANLRAVGTSREREMLTGSIGWTVGENLGASVASAVVQRLGVGPSGDNVK